MKLKNGFILRKIAGEIVVVPAGGELDLNMMITLNETGAFLWEHLGTGAEEAELVSALLKEYDVDETTARRCVSEFVKKVKTHGFLA